MGVLNAPGLKLRVVDRDGEPWFVAKDVCGVLGHTNTTVAMVRIDADDQAKQSLGEPPPTTDRDTQTIPHCEKTINPGDTYRGRIGRP